jgi:class 3 adenylate cyclase/pimeloyl-ACP methyl ester carboxylesterase
VDLPQTRYARSGEAYIAYQVVGEGPVDLLLAPHFFHHLELWWEDRFRADFTRRLAQLARVILLDKRGTGMSDRTGGVPPFDVQMDDVRAVLDAAGSERAVLLSGGDATPMIVLFAATFPGRTLGLVLWDPFPTYIRAPDMPWLMTRAEFDAAVEATAAALEDPMPDDLLEELSPSVGSDEEAFAVWRVSRVGTSPGDHLAFTRVLAETDVRHVLPTIRVPTLVLSSEATVARQETNRYVAERIPTARLVIVPGRDRMMFVGDTGGIIDEVGSFLDDIRDRPPDEPDRVLATVLFTDIVGSTARAAELGDSAWRELLRQHHARVRRELARFRGREVDTAGDGFFATFDGPARAIRCAIAVRDAVKGLGLEIRSGLHAGECELLDGKVTGIAVSLGARVVSLAQPGEVLVSSTVKDLVAGSGISFAERGPFELKGVPGRWSLFAVEATAK